MTAAIYGRRAGKSVVLFERLTAGGQILKTTKIANYPGFKAIMGEELASNLREQVVALGGEIESAEVSTVARKGTGFLVETDDEPVLARTVILANGSTERKLGLPEEADYVSKGVSYCATCDGEFYRGKTAAVYGGGNTAAYSVMYLAGICEHVFWIFRKPEPRAEKSLTERVRKLENVEVFNNTVIAGLRGEGKLEGLKFDDGREVNLDALFVSIGREANNERFASLVELDEAGYIKAGEDCQTSQVGVFCAGDTRAKKLHQIVTAAADGAVAANAAIEYINSQDE